jgi:hypothetical protein
MLSAYVPQRALAWKPNAVLLGSRTAERAGQAGTDPLRTKAARCRGCSCAAPVCTSSAPRTECHTTDFPDSCPPASMASGALPRGAGGQARALPTTARIDA